MVPIMLSWLHCYSLFAAIVCDSLPEKVKEMGAYYNDIQKMWWARLSVWMESVRVQKREVRSWDFFLVVLMMPYQLILDAVTWVIIYQFGMRFLMNTIITIVFVLQVEHMPTLQQSGVIPEEGTPQSPWRAAGV